MDESLAKGLAGRFIDEHSEFASEAIAAIDALRWAAPLEGFSKTRRWQDHLLSVRKALGRALISTASYGSERKKLVVLNFAGAPMLNPITEWDEPAVPIDFVALQCPYPVLPLATTSRCYIGKHAIARIFQRFELEATNDGKSFQFYTIASELAPLALWSTIWLTLLEGLVGRSDAPDGELALPVPAPNGMFFATLNATRSRLNVRTYVHDRQLSIEQSRLKEKLHGAIRADEREPIQCMSTAVKTPGAGLALRAVVSRMATFSELWLPRIFEKIGQSAESVQLQAIVTRTAENFGWDDHDLSCYEAAGFEAVARAMRQPDPETALFKLYSAM
ncbi:hypothetical protein V4C53_10470 [Paraburkholderia azotifigens]|uniref:hypothetical protein n=1 Tax=Paraburkholderia azotifigens TaxID=2057004 RepID=UPI00317797C4